MVDGGVAFKRRPAVVVLTLALTMFFTWQVVDSAMLGDTMWVIVLAPVAMLCLAELLVALLLPAVEIGPNGIVVRRGLVAKRFAGWADMVALVPSELGGLELSLADGDALRVPTGSLSPKSRRQLITALESRVGHG